MGIETYKVLDGETVLARGMSLNTAILLIKALMMEYYADEELAYTIKRENGQTNGTQVGGGSA